MGVNNTDNPFVILPLESVSSANRMRSVPLVLGTVVLMVLVTRALTRLLARLVDLSMVLPARSLSGASSTCSLIAMNCLVSASMGVPGIHIAQLILANRTVTLINDAVPSARQTHIVLTLLGEMR